jgi:hypothetical protein
VTGSRQTEDTEEGDEDFEIEKEDEEEEEEEEKEKAAKEQAPRKGRKHATNSDGDIEGVEKPRKRSKAADGTVRGVSISKKVEKDEEEEEEEKAAKELASRKGKKRVTNSAEEVEKPRKRSKAADGMMRDVSISKKEVRQKLSVNIDEKKKRIALLSKSSKSTMLGKKGRNKSDSSI